MTPQELGQKVKAKYPQYASLSDEDVAMKVSEKYPQYKSALSEAPQRQAFKPDVGKALSETVKDPMFFSQAISGQAPMAVMERLYDQPKQEALNMMDLPENSVQRMLAGFGIDMAALNAPDMAAGAARGVARGALRPAQKAAEGMAGRLINQMIKPGKAQYNYGRNPGVEIAKQGITGLTRGGFEKNVSKRLGSLKGQLESEVGKHSEPIDIMPAFKTMHDELTNIIKLPEIGAEQAEQVRMLEGDIAGLAGSKKIPGKTLLEIKRRVGKIPSWAAKDPRFGTLTDISRKVYRSLDNVMDEAIPKTKGLNESVSNLIGAEDAIKGGVAREQNKAFVGLFDRLGPTGIGGALGYGAGGGPGGIAGVLAALGLTKLAKSTPMTTGTAKTLSSASRIPASIAGLLEKAQGPGIAKQVLEAIKPKSRSLVPK